MAKSISREFESRLSRLNEDSKLQVIVTSDSPGNFGEMRSYFSQENVEVHGYWPLLGSVCVDLTKSQIYSLAEKPYIRSIMENQEIRPL
ncbi:hypothetical protein HYT23_03475 [Candidatus Pacearchaeota archaeon]|nr:hypothetical protein [Candidatus Pacearchaeota archaeon]